MKHPIPVGRQAALGDSAYWRSLKGLVSAIAEQFGIEPEAAGTMLHEGMSAHRIAHRDAMSGVQNWIVDQQGAEWAKRSGLKYDEHIDWRDGTLNPPGGRSYPLEVYWPDVIRQARKMDATTTPTRRRGRTPTARQSAVAAMIQDLNSGKQTRESLALLKQ